MKVHTCETRSYCDACDDDAHRSSNPSVIKLIPTTVFDTPDAHRIEWTIGNQTFSIGPDYFDTEEEAQWFGEMFQKALDAYRGTDETTCESGEKP